MGWRPANLHGEHVLLLSGQRLDWKKPPAFRQHLAVKVYKQQRSPPQVTQLAHAMQLRFHRDSFPEAHNNSGGYDHSPSYRIALANCTIDPILGARVPSSPDHYLR